MLPPEMGGRSGNDEQVALRLPKEWTERADRLRESGVIAAPGVGVTRSDVLRAAISRGLVPRYVSTLLLSITAGRHAPDAAIRI